MLRQEEIRKIVRIRDHFDTRFKEYIVGSKQTASRGIDLVLGEMKAGEVRQLGPGEDASYFSAGGRVPGGHGG